MSSSPSSDTIEEGKKHAEEPIPDGTNTTIITDPVFEKNYGPLWFGS